MAELADQAEVLLVGREVDALGGRDALDEKSPCVMPGLFVFRTGVTEADDQLNGSHDRGSLGSVNE
ncbi:hypothetical protein D3C81_2035120 [compost metagenome]